MSEEFNLEKIINAAKELGLNITVDSTNAGLYFPNDNTHYSWDEVNDLFKDKFE